MTFDLPKKKFPHLWDSDIGDSKAKWFIRYYHKKKQTMDKKSLKTTDSIKQFYKKIT